MEIPREGGGGFQEPKFLKESMALIKNGISRGGWGGVGSS